MQSSGTRKYDCDTFEQKHVLIFFSDNRAKYISKGLPLFFSHFYCKVVINVLNQISNDKNFCRVLFCIPETACPEQEFFGETMIVFLPG